MCIVHRQREIHCFTRIGEQTKRDTQYYTYVDLNRGIDRYRDI